MITRQEGGRSPFADFGEKRVREEAVPPAKLVLVNVELNGGGD